MCNGDCYFEAQPCRQQSGTSSRSAPTVRAQAQPIAICTDGQPLPIATPRRQPPCDEHQNSPQVVVRLTWSQRFAASDVASTIGCVKNALRNNGVIEVTCDSVATISMVDHCINPAPKESKSRLSVTKVYNNAALALNRPVPHPFS